MSWVAVGVGGAAVVGGTVGYLSGKKEKTNPYGQLNPEQIQTNKLLGSRLNSLLGQGPQYYGGQLTEPITQEELAAISSYNRSSLLSGNTLDRLINVDESQFNENFQREMVDPTMDNFTRNVAPLIDESLPTFSTERGYARQRALGDINNNLSQTRFMAREAMKDRSLTAIRDLLSKGQIDLAMNAVPREIRQAGLDKQYLDWIGANDKYGKDINSALNFLGIGTGTYSPDTRFGNMLAGASVFGSIAGSMGAGGGGGTTGSGQMSTSQVRAMQPYYGSYVKY